jgi:hypothetical protein
MIDVEDVYWFRCDTKCTFQGTFYKVTGTGEDEGGDYTPFPGTMLFDVPQHFTAVKAGNAPGVERAVYMGPDSKTQALRDAFFAAYLPMMRVDTGVSEADRHAKAELLKANFFAYGQATNPEGQPAVDGPSGPTEAEIKAQVLQEEIDALKAKLAEASAPKVEVPVEPVADPASEPAPVTEGGSP